VKRIILVIGLTVNGCVESFLWKKVTRQLLRNIPLAANVEHRYYWKIEYVDLLREVEHEQHNLDRITRFVRSRSTGLEALKFVIPVGAPMMRHVQDLIKFYSLLANLEEVEGLVINPDVRAEHGVYQLEVNHAPVADAEMATTATSTPTVYDEADDDDEGKNNVY
jgi:hypothetical protein